MLRGTRAAALAAACLLLAPAALSAKGGALGADHPFIALLARSKLERGREHRALLVMPITSETGDPDGTTPAATPDDAARQEQLSVGEPEKKPGRGPVELFNWSTKPILLLAGEVLEGGHRDRFLCRDVLLGPGSRVEVPALPADRKPRPKDEQSRVLRPLGAVAPDLLRLVGLVDGPAGAAESFLEDEFALSGQPPGRGALPDLFRNEKLADRITAYRGMFAAVPGEFQRRVVGVAAVVGGRLTGIEVFGTNAGFREHWPRILRTLAFQASLYELTYGLLDQPFALGKDPDRYRAAVEPLLRKCYAARADRTDALDLGEELVLTRDELIARVLLAEDRVVHALLMIDYLSRPPAAGPPPDNAGAGREETAEELERRDAEGRRLTEYERRLLERMRERRRNPGGSGGAIHPPSPPNLPAVPGGD